MTGKIHIIGGGTFSHVRAHMAIAAPAFGATAIRLHELIDGSVLHLTKMADRDSDLVTNRDISDLIDQLIADPDTRAIIMNVAMCDFEGQIADVPSGKYAERLRTDNGLAEMVLTPSEKIVSKIRKHRKDIFAVGFKTTAGADPTEQHLRGLRLLKSNSLNLVLANDLTTRLNMVIAPEESRYYETTDRDEALRGLAEMILGRIDNTFTRSTVVEGDLVKFQTDPRVPANLRKVVNHMVERGAYKVFGGSTAGHFAVRIDDGSCMTSRRKTDYTKEGGLDLVEIEYQGLEKVIAKGAKPSVGGQSQRIVFDTYPDLDCIVHAHIPLKADRPIPVAAQSPYECGSHQCGANTASNLIDFGQGIKAVMLDNHGPNVVFGKDADPDAVIAFIEENFDLDGSTSVLVADRVL